MDRVTAVAIGAALSSGLLTSHHSRAEPIGRPAPDSAYVTFRDCESELARMAFAAATLELKGAGIERINGPDGALAEERAQVELTIECPGKERVTAHALDEATGTSAVREVPLDDVQTPDRPRVIALALSELLTALGYRLANQAPSIEPPSSPAPPTHIAEASSAPQRAPQRRVRSTPLPPTRSNRRRRTTRPPAAAAAPPRTSAAERTVFPVVAGRARFYPVYETVLLGASAGIQVRRFRAELEGFGSNSEDILGRVFAGVAAVAFGYDVARLSRDTLTLRAGSKASAGITWAFAEATPSDVETRDVTRPYSDVRGFAGLDVALRPLTVQLEADAGYALGLRANADVRTVAATGGWFLGTAAGLKF